MVKPLAIRAHEMLCRALGLTESYPDRSGCLFDESEVWAMRVFLTNFMLYGWEGYLLPQEQGLNYFVYFTFDEDAVVNYRTEDTYSEMFEELSRWKPERLEGWY